jgi:hypothetical protein
VSDNLQNHQISTLNSAIDDEKKSLAQLEIEHELLVKSKDDEI